MTTRTFALTVVAVTSTYTVTVNAVATGAIAYDANATAVKAALVAVDDSFTAADFTVTGTAPDFTVVTPSNIAIAEVDPLKATVDETVSSIRELAAAKVVAKATLSALKDEIASRAGQVDLS